ncbi:hypothetical protein PV342_13280 [Streptomyces sp. PA03-3a]|nr:hypothetical protein [Streptomyces sp. PA03-3a]
MRGSRILAAAAMTAAAVIYPASMASAFPGDQLVISPLAVKTGETVTVSTNGNPCAVGQTANGVSDADGSFVLTTTDTNPNANSTRTGQFKVSDWATPGIHTVTVTCATGQTYTGRFEVTGSGASPSPSPGDGHGNGGGRGDEHGGYGGGHGGGGGGGR